jgi:hypothetical protein
VAERLGKLIKIGHPIGSGRQCSKLLPLCQLIFAICSEFNYKMYAKIRSGIVPNLKKVLSSPTAMFSLNFKQCIHVCGRKGRKGGRIHSRSNMELAVR